MFNIEIMHIEFYGAWCLFVIPIFAINYLNFKEKKTYKNLICRFFVSHSITFKKSVFLYTHGARYKSKHLELRKLLIEISS